MLTIDGSMGEGGGQILRTALALSLVTGQEFRISDIRAGRDKPGLLAQHLAAVDAATAISHAEAQGTSPGSRELVFRPRQIAAGHHAFAVGTAGSATLVLQTILPALALAPAASSLVLEGGTHNPFAPPFEFIARAYLPLLNRMGPQVRAKLDRHGFYPAGGGKIRVTVEPVSKLERFDLVERGGVLRCRAKAVVANLPRHVAEREIKVLKRKLPLAIEDLEIEEVAAHGPGNVAMVQVEARNLTEVFTGFGERGVRAELVAERTSREARRYLDAGVAVGEYLADQIMLPLALAGGGSFTTMALSRHATTNIEVLKLFLPLQVGVRPFGDEGDGVLVEIERG